MASASVDHGLEHGAPLPVEPERFAPELRERRASFVTLRIASTLRGCTGTLEASRPLVVDVSCNAYAAAFRDPRFAPLAPAERAAIELHVSILSVPEPLAFGSEQELLGQLVPGVHGLVIGIGAQRATFLPAVWEQIPDRRSFLAALKRKAGLPADVAIERLQASRYTVEDIVHGRRT